MSEGYLISHIHIYNLGELLDDEGSQPRMGGLLWFRVFCTFVVTSLMNSSFPAFLLSLPISHFFISFFLVFSLFFIFNAILALTKKMV
jgi:hypothetical protein